MGQDFKENMTAQVLEHVLCCLHSLEVAAAGFEWVITQIAV